jgi:antitoxin ParD1/3/4
MTIHLSGNREEFVRSLVQGGQYASEDEVIDEALRLLRQREESEKARVLEGIRQGIEDMKAGRCRPADEVFADIRREFNLSPDA